MENVKVPHQFPNNKYSTAFIPSTSLDFVWPSILKNKFYNYTVFSSESSKRPLHYCHKPFQLNAHPVDQLHCMKAGKHYIVVSKGFYVEYSTVIRKI